MSGSPFAWRVLVACALKGVEYESQLLSFQAGDTKTAAFRALNPRGTVPVLVDGELVLTESLAIVHYLDQTHPSPSLFGEGAEETARRWSQALDLEGHFVVDARTVARACFRDQVEEQWEPLQAAVARIDDELARLSDLLGDGARSDDDVSILDVIAYPALMQLLRGLDKPIAASLERSSKRLAERHPPLFAWRERFASRPGIDATYPPHWRDADG